MKATTTTLIFLTPLKTLKTCYGLLSCYIMREDSRGHYHDINDECIAQTLESARRGLRTMTMLKQESGTLEEARKGLQE
jgi:hypothetical protein